MKHTTRKSIRLFALIIAIAALLNFLPFGTLVSPFIVNAGTEPHNFTPPSQESDAFTTNPISVQNANFTEGKQDSFADAVSGWEHVDTSTMAISGILNTDSSGFDTFKKNRHLENLSFFDTNPFTNNDTDSHVLAMANTTSGTSLVSYHSSNISLSPNSYYQISVDFYALGSESIIYLVPVDSNNTQENTKPNPSIPIYQIYSTGNNSKSQWRTASFFVSTDMLSSETFKLGLYLGGSDATAGVVYYDTVRVTELGAETFYRYLDIESSAQNPNSPFVRSVELNKSDDKIVIPETVFNFNAPNTIFTPITPERSGTQAKSFAWLHEIPTVTHLNFEERNYLHGNGSIDNRGALLVSAVESEQGIHLSNPITIERQLVYMISFYTLATDYSFIRITDYHIDADDADERFKNTTAYDSGFLDIKRDVSLASHNNNWVLNTVFLKGNALYDTEINVEFWAGDASNKTGYLLVDDFAVTLVSDEYFTQHKAGANATTLTIKELDDTTPIFNGEFNFGTVNNVATPFPLKAANWNPTQEDADQTFSGVVNTETVTSDLADLDPHWTRQANKDYKDGWNGYSMAASPGAIPYSRLGRPQHENNNVYMMQNKSATWQKLTSTPFTIEREKVHQISFDAVTYVSSGDTIKAWAIIESSNNEIARIPLGRTINFNSERMGLWDNYTFKIETSKFTSREITISFLLGEDRFNHLSAGVLFIDNVEVTTDADKTIHAEIDLNDTTKLARFEDNANRGESLSFQESKDPEADAKAYAHYNKETNALEMGTRGTQHTKVINSMTESIEADKYYAYKINVRVTIDTSELDLSNYDDDGKKLDDHDYGVNFYLDGMKGGFFNVKEDWLEGLETHDGQGYAELTFYIKADSFKLALVVEFGSDDISINASVGIKGSSLTEITQGDFEFQEGKAEERPYVSMVTGPLDQNDDGDDGDDDGDGINFDFLIIPSIITAVALIFALIAVLIRRMKFRTHIERRESSYARDDAVARGKRDIKATKAVKNEKGKSKKSEKSVD